MAEQAKVRLVWLLRSGALREGEIGKDIDPHEVVGVYETTAAALPVLPMREDPVPHA